ncbi:MAG: hypothetical protein AAGI63_00400 [Planctomycetota bacterium]
MIRICWLTCIVVASATYLHADLVPVGNKGVTHKLVFTDSPLLETHRIIAAPVRGFGGHAEVRPDQPFYFSTKYGTRLYVVPADYEVPKKVGPGKTLPFPSCDVPVTATTYVPMYSPTDSLRSTCRLLAVTDEAIEVELVDHVELDSNGEPVSLSKSLFPMLLISLTGLVGCCVIWRRTRSGSRAEY